MENSFFYIQSIFQLYSISENKVFNPIISRYLSIFCNFLILYFHPENSNKCFQWVLGKSVEKLMRESPPECLLDPQLGRHLHVKINVREKKTKTSQFHFAPDIVTFQGLQVPLCGGRVS